MNLVEFVEARISEQESRLRGRGSAQDRALEQSIMGIAFPTALRAALLSECALKRSILAKWRSAAEAEGIQDPVEAEGALALTRGAMLRILGAEYKEHPDYPGKAPPHLG